jgi:hypothetical protein
MGGGAGYGVGPSNWLIALAVRGLALAANRKNAKHAKRTIGLNIFESLLKSFQQSLLESFYPQESIGFICEFPNPEKLFPKLGTCGEGWSFFKH